MRSPHSAKLRYVVATIVTCSAGTAGASSFALLEQSASRLGTAFAGTAAAADDATTVFYNPAGLGTLKQTEAAVVFSEIDVGSKFKNRSSQAALGQPLGVEGSDAGGWNFVPATYFAMPINDSLAVGFALNAPFGLKLEYDSDWIGRFQAERSEIKTYNANPALSWRLNKVVTLGVGVDYQKVQAELTNQINYSAVVAQGAQQLAAAGQLSPAQAQGVIAANAGLSGTAVVRGDDAAWGYNLGVLFELPSSTRIGLSYRSSIDYHVEGSARFAPPTPTNPTGAAIVAAAGQSALANSRASLNLELPDSAILSVAQPMGDFQLLADVAWTGWSSVQELRVIRESGAVLSVTPERWEDTWRFALGGVYRLNDAWKLRAGVAYDETPVPTATRTARLPDADRKWLAVGTQWAVSPQLVIDAGYARLFSKDSRIDQNAGSTLANGLIGGEQQSSVNIVSAQFSYRW
ncbi:MAG: outer membrane protein transport protein [Steroidobacteraceae bacterium]